MTDISSLSVRGSSVHDHVYLLLHLNFSIKFVFTVLVCQPLSTCLLQFLRDFDQYQYTEEESDAILEAFVWPQVIF